MQLPHGTYLATESDAYPHGGQTRACRAIYPDGKVRRCWAGIPDTFFSIPAHGRIRGRYVAGWVTIDDGLDSPTRGALIFHLGAKYR